MRVCASAVTHRMIDPIAGRMRIHASGNLVIMPVVMTSWADVSKPTQCQPSMAPVW
jgi:hypothetical protein